MAAFKQDLIDGIARLEINVDGEPVNKISREVKEELDSILPSLQADERVRAVVFPCLGEASDSTSCTIP